VLRSSPYKIRRKGEKMPGGKEELAEELEALEVLKLRKVTEEIMCRRSFENSLSLEREIVISMQGSRGIIGV
jgi:hypothetical protein